MKDIISKIKLFLLFVKMSWASQVSYSGWSVMTGYLAHFLGYAANYAVMWAMLRNFPRMGEFNLWEVFVLYSIDLISYSAANSFLQPFWNMKELVLRARLDEFLTKPINPMFHLIGRGFQPGYLGHIAVGLAGVIAAFAGLGILGSIRAWGIFLIAVVLAFGIQTGFRCISAFASFWFGNVDRLQGIVVGLFRGIIRYPLSIYPHFIRTIFTVILPYGFVNYYPSLFLFKKMAPATGVIMFLIGAVISAAMVILSITMFYRGLRRYESAGG